MGKKNIFKKIKDWIVGKDSKVKEANRVTNYGGGASSKSVQKEVKRSIVKAEAKKRGEKQTAYQQSAVSKSSSSAFKATPPSVRKAEAKDRQTSKKSDAFNAKNAFKASAQPKFTHQSTALGTMSKRDIDTRTAKINAYNENRKYQSRAADKLKPLIDEKYSGDTAESRRRIKSGEYQSDPNVMKYETLKHPIAMSAGRGALSGATFGLSELGMALLPKSKEVEEAERLYQANKSKGAEFAGEMVGSLLGFGLTGGASKAAVKGVAPKTTARLGESATEYLAKNGLVRRAAEKEALRKLGTTATKEEIERFARARAAKLVAALGEDAAVNLTTSAVADVAQAVVDSDNPAEFLKNLGINVGMDWTLGFATSAIPAFRGSNVDDAFVRNLPPPKASDRVFAGDVFNKANRANVDEGLERINIRDMARPSAQNMDAQVDDSLDELIESATTAETPKVEVKAEAPKTEVKTDATVEAPKAETEELPKPEAESLKETAQKRADEVMGAEYKEQKPKTKEIPEKTKEAADKKADDIRAELAKEDIDPNLKAENPEDNIRAALAEDKTKARAKEEKISKGQAAVREAYEEQTGESWKVGKNGFESDADKRATFDQLWDARKEYHQSQGRETERKLSKYASTQVRVASKERADYIIDNIIKHSQDAEYDVLHHEEVYREVAENLEKDWDTWVNKLSDVADGGDWGGKDTPKLLATAQFLGELIDDVPRTPETDALAKIAYLAGQKLTTSSAQTMNFRRHFAHLSPASKLDVIMDDLAKTLDNAQGFNKKHAKGLKGLNHWERLDYIKGQLMDDPKLKDAVEKMVYAKTPEELDVMKRRNEGLISQIEGLEKQKAELEKKLKAAEAKAKASGKATLPQDVDEMAQIKDLDVEIEGLNAQKQILDSQIEKAEKANVDPDELTKAQAKVIRAFNKHNAKTGYDVVQELRYIAMLLNPKTHIRNVGGSGFFSPVRDLSNTIRAGVEEGVFKHYGMEVDVKHGGLTSLIGNTEAGKKATEAINKSEIRNALYGNSKLTELPTQRGRGKTLAGKALDAVSDFSSWTLKKEDDAFKTLAFKKNYIMSYNKYLKDGVPITPKIEAAIEAEAIQEAKIATFNEYNAVANALNKFYKNSTNANASGAMRWAARGTNALMPFTKAPANLMKQSINYSPLGLAKGMYAIKQAGKKGDAQALNRAIDELSSGVTGTGIYVLGALLGGTTDMFTTNVGKDDLGAKFKKDRGYQNYSVNFVDPETGKGHSFTLDWLVPNSAAFFMGVETANQIKKNGFSIFDVVHAAGDWAQVTSRLAEPVMDTSMLSGLNSMIEGVRGNYNGDDQLGVPHILLRETVQSYLNSLVPSVLGQTTRTLYKTDKQILGDSDWKYWANSTRSKAGLANLDIETLGGALGADTDVYGNVRNDKGKRFTEAVKDKDKAALTEYGKSALKNFFSPANIQKIDMSEVDKEKLAEYEKRVAAGEDPSKLSYLFPKKAGEWQRNFSYGYGDEDDAGNKTDIKMTNKEISLYNKAKAKGGAEGMRAALSNYIFHRFDADEKGHYTIPHDDNITPEEAEKLIKKFEGKSIREVEQWLYQDPRFKKANKAEQKQVLEDLWKLDGTGMATGSRREGERAVIKARGGDLVDYDYKNETPERVQKNLQEALDKGIVTAEQALDFTRNAVKYGYYPSADGKGGGTVTPYYNKKEMMEYLAKSGYSYEECEALYNAFRKKGSKEFSGIDLSSGGWHGYGYRRWHRWGSYQRKGRKPSNEMPSGFKAKKSRVSSGGSNVSAPNVSGGINTKSTASRMSTSPKINITPLNIKTVRANSGKPRRNSSNLSTALEDIQKTEKKVKPPKARRSK